MSDEQDDTSYGASPIKREKRFRRTKAAMTDIREGLYAICEEYQPLTVRNAFYRAVARGLIDKTEKQYDTVQRLLVEMRRANRLPYGWITDSTRLQRKPNSHSNLEAALEDSRLTYRRALWRDQDVNVEIWIEKDAIMGVVYDVTSKWDVPLMSARGYASLTFLKNAAEEIAESDKPTVIYYFGDYDPSGLHIPKKIEEDLRGFAPDAKIEFHRAAVNADQVLEYELPTRPTKPTDKRPGQHDKESVEIDAFEPNVLRKLVEECIKKHIDQDELARTQLVEAAEKETLENFCGLATRVQTDPKARQRIFEVLSAPARRNHLEGEPSTISSEMPRVPRRGLVGVVLPQTCTAIEPAA
jgi:hypothetical protein